MINEAKIWRVKYVCKVFKGVGIVGRLGVIRNGKGSQTSAECGMRSAEWERNFTGNEANEGNERE